MFELHLLGSSVCVPSLFVEVITKNYEKIYQTCVCCSLYLRFHKLSKQQRELLLL